MRLDFVEQVMNKFFVKISANSRSHEVSKESHETNETNETTHAETCICEECLPE